MKRRLKSYSTNVFSYQLYLNYKLIKYIDKYEIYYMSHFAFYLCV